MAFARSHEKTKSIHLAGLDRAGYQQIDSIARKFASDVRRFPGTVDFVEVGAGEDRLLEDFAAASSLS